MVNLLELRKEKGLSQKELADKTNISESYYCLIENKERRPSPEVAIRIGNILDFDWTTFFDNNIS